MFTDALDSNLDEVRLSSRRQAAVLAVPAPAGGRVAANLSRRRYVTVAKVPEAAPANSEAAARARGSLSPLSGSRASPAARAGPPRPAARLSRGRLVPDHICSVAGSAATGSGRRH